MERLLSVFFEPFLCSNHCLGSSQLAYQKERGARDALAFLVLSWISALNKRREIGVCRSDVAGAIDKVDKSRMIRKLRKSGLDESIVAVLTSWLRTQPANVIVAGESSEEFDLQNKVFQKTI